MEYVLQACMPVFKGLFTGTAAVSSIGTKLSFSKYLPAASLCSSAVAKRYNSLVHNATRRKAIQSFQLQILTISLKPVTALQEVRRHALYNDRNYVFVAISATDLKCIPLQLYNDISYMKSKHTGLILL